jgi:hypothetical protein
MWNNKTWRIILLSVFGVWFAYKLNQTFYDFFFFDALILFFIAVVGLLIFIRAIRKDTKEFETSRKIKSYLSSAIGLFFILINIGIYVYQYSKTNAPSLIRGFYDGGFNGFSVDFMINGNYVMANGSGLGETFFYGTYSLKDSIITIDKSNIDNCIKTNRLVIRTESYYPSDNENSKNGQANYMTQIDKNGKEIDNEFRFRIIVDNRKKEK